MPTNSQQPIAPDFEERHRLALALCQHLSINPKHVDLGSLVIELGPDQHHIVRWNGHTRLTLDDLTALIVTTRIAHTLEDTGP